MASKQYIQMFTNNYESQIKEVLGRDINTDSYKEYFADIKTLYEAVDDRAFAPIFEAMKKDVTKYKQEFEKKKDKPLSLSTVNRLYSKYTDGLTELVKSDTHVKQEGYEKELLQRRIDLFRMNKLIDYIEVQTGKEFDFDSISNAVMQMSLDGVNLTDKDIVERVIAMADTLKEETKTQDEQKEEPSVDNPEIEEENEPVVNEPEVQEENEPVVNEPEVQEENEPIVNEPEVQEENEPVVNEPEAQEEDEPIVDVSSENHQEQTEPTLDMNQEDLEQANNMSQDESIVNSSGEWEDKYLAIDKKLNSVEMDIRAIIVKYGQECDSQIGFVGDIQQDANMVLDLLDDSKKGAFVKEINAQLSKTKQIKEQIAEEFLNITEEGIKTLRETAMKISDAEAQKEKEEEELKNLEEELLQAQEILESYEKDESFDEKSVKGQKDLIEELKGKINDKKDKIESITKDLKEQKQEFENSKDEYLKVADDVKKKLESRGISIGIKQKENIENNSQEQTVQNVVNNEVGVQTPDVQTQNIQTAQVVAPQQGSMNVVQQVPVQNQNLPSTNLNMREQFNQNYKNIIDKSQDIDNVFYYDEYKDMADNFTAIAASPYKLNGSQRKALRNVFENNKEKILAQMKAADFDDPDLLNTITDIVGDKNRDLIVKELSGNGQLLNEVTVDEATQRLLLNTVTWYNDAIKEGRITEDQMEIFEKNVMKPLRFSYLEQAAEVEAKFGGKKMFGFIPTKRGKIDDYMMQLNVKIQDIGEQLYNMQNEVKENDKIDEKENNELQLENVQQEQVVNVEKKEAPKDFKDMLNGLINSNEEINLKDSVNIDARADRINWNNKTNDSKKNEKAR